MSICLFYSYIFAISSIRWTIWLTTLVPFCDTCWIIEDVFFWKIIIDSCISNLFYNVSFRIFFSILFIIFMTSSEFFIFYLLRTSTDYVRNFISAFIVSKLLLKIMCCCIRTSYMSSYISSNLLIALYTSSAEMTLNIFSLALITV